MCVRVHVFPFVSFPPSSLPLTFSLCVGDRGCLLWQVDLKRHDTLALKQDHVVALFGMFLGQVHLSWRTFHLFVRHALFIVPDYPLPANHHTQGGMWLYKRNVAPQCILANRGTRLLAQHIFVAHWTVVCPMHRVVALNSRPPGQNHPCVW